jgi:hypothetical protein
MDAHNQTSVDRMATRQPAPKYGSAARGAMPAAIAVLLLLLCACRPQLLAGCAPTDLEDWVASGTDRITGHTDGEEFVLHLLPGCPMPASGGQYAVVTDLRACGAGPDYLQIMNATGGNSARCVIARVESTIDTVVIPE